MLRAEEETGMSTRGVRFGSVAATYEAATLKGAKKGEIQVGPSGESLAHEE